MLAVWHLTDKRNDGRMRRRLSKKSNRYSRKTRQGQGRQDKTRQDTIRSTILHKAFQEDLLKNSIEVFSWIQRTRRSGSISIIIHTKFKIRREKNYIARRKHLSALNVHLRCFASHKFRSIERYHLFKNHRRNDSVLRHAGIGMFLNSFSVRSDDICTPATWNNNNNNNNEIFKTF